MSSVFGVQGPVSSEASAKVAQALSAPKTTTTPSAGASSSSAAATAGGAITSSDFLTLLVSELKNQDPTQPTDPNAYIQQLVGVNSLQELISINSGLTTFETPVPTPPVSTPAPAGGA